MRCVNEEDDLDLPFVGMPAEFGKCLAAETDKWGKVVREAGLNPD